MITLQRRIFSLTAASPSGGAVIFVLQPVFPPFHIYIFPLFISFPAILSAVLYFHILYPPPPLDRHIFSLISSLPPLPQFHIIISPARSRPSHISVLLSSPPPLGRHIFPYYYIPRALSAVPYFHIIISPAAPAPADNPSIIYPPPRRWIQFFLVFILYGRPCAPMCGGRSVCGRENFSVSVLRNAFRARSLDVFGMLGDPVPRVVKGGR